MQETELLERKELREQTIARVEVLEKVKHLFLIPEMEVMTARQVAEYYEVDLHTVFVLYDRNKDEINSDGVSIKSYKDFLKSQDVTLESKTKGKVTISVHDSITLEVPNRGIRVFPQRAILRIGMLLRDSEVAKEVRTQLLNTFEYSTDEQRTQEITNEQELYLAYAKAAIDGNKEDVLEAAKEVFDYKNRHISKLEEERLNYRRATRHLPVRFWSGTTEIN